MAIAVEHDKVFLLMLFVTEAPQSLFLFLVTKQVLKWVWWLPDPEHRKLPKG